MAEDLGLSILVLSKYNSSYLPLLVSDDRTIFFQRYISHLSRNKNPLWQAHIHREGRSPHWLYINCFVLTKTEGWLYLFRRSAPAFVNWVPISDEKQQKAETQLFQCWREILHSGAAIRSAQLSILNKAYLLWVEKLSQCVIYSVYWSPHYISFFLLLNE